MTANVRIGLGVAAFLVAALGVTTLATANQGMGSSGKGSGGRPQQTGPDGGPTQEEIIVRFVKPSTAPEEAYRRTIEAPN
jgi:hypothetical protein